MERVNRFLDLLPRTRLGRWHREVPAFRTCGIVGYYVALITLFAGTLLAGHSLIVAALVALVCGLSFFAYGHLRRVLTGHEEIVLLEHVWFAQLCVAAALWGLRETLPPYLDVMSPALALFLAWGRVGCLLVGCCHGNPSSVGIVYPQAHADDGFERHLVGVRLFPVPLIEAVGLVAIGLSGLAALPLAPPGRVFLWLLIGYAVMRFGLEGLRGDRRPHLLGLSQARWMSLVEFGVALVLYERWGGRALGLREAILGALFVAVLVGCLILRRALNPGRRVLAPRHVKELREAVCASAENATETPAPRGTHAGVVAVVSRDGDRATAAPLRVSLSLRDGGHDLRLLCDLAATALPGASPSSAHYSERGVLHLALAHASDLPTEADAVPVSRRGAAGTRALADRIYGAAVRAAQPEQTESPRDSASLAREQRAAYFGARSGQ